MCDIRDFYLNVFFFLNIYKKNLTINGLNNLKVSFDTFFGFNVFNTERVISSYITFKIFLS